MANPRIAHGFAQEVRIVREISEGVNIASKCRVAPYLPVKLVKYQGHEPSPVVILAGTLIALDQWNQIVPANNGVAVSGNLVYTALDVTYGTFLYDGAIAYGKGAAATVATTKNMPANNLIGYALQDIYANEDYLNYKVDTDVKGIGTRRFVEYPIITEAQAAGVQGDIVVPDEDNIGQWKPLVAADVTSYAEVVKSLSNRFGKIIKIYKITANLDKLDIVVGAPGLSLHATKDAPGGAGIPNYLQSALSVARTSDDETGGTSNAVEYKYRAEILVRI